MTIQTKLLTQAVARLMDAAGMLRMEAGEWRSRKNEQPKNFEAMTDKAWADKCERVAKINEAAADAMIETAKQIAQASTAAVGDPSHHATAQTVA